MILTTAIIDLLRKHNCVVIPGFGGFIANYKPAVVDTVRQQIIPPTKHVLFNHHITENDGLLGNFIAKTKGWTYPDALDYIQTISLEWNDELAKGERVEIGELGFLFKREDQMVFEQNRDFQLLLQAYGLTNVRFVDWKAEEKEKAQEKTVHAADSAPKETVTRVEEVREKKEETPVIALQNDRSIEEVSETEANEHTEQVEEPARKRGWMKYAVAAAAIPFLFYAYWIPMETDFIHTGNIQMADFNPIHKTPDRTYQSRFADFSPEPIAEVTTWEELTADLSDHVEVYNYQFDDNLYIPVRLDKTEVDLEETTNKVDEATVMTTDKPYHVIGGCFSVKQNAENLVADLKEQGYAASIVDFHNGLYRVSSGAYGTSDTAENKLERFRNDGFKGWILKK